jgi:hypothetical protein
VKRVASRAHVLVAAIGMSSALLASCGGKGKTQQTSDGGPEVVHAQTSVGADEPLGALSSDELTQLCTDVTPALVTTACTVLGITAAKYMAFDTTLTDADLKAACRSATSDCVSHGGAGQPDCVGADSPPSSSCIATVGDYVACVNATGDAFPTCSQVTRAFLGSEMPVAEPAACQALDQECPDLNGMPTAAYAP